MKSLSPSAFSRKGNGSGGGGGGEGIDQFDHQPTSLHDGCHFRQQPSLASDATLLYGTIRPHNNNHQKPSNGNSIITKRDAMPEPSADLNSNAEIKELNYRTLNGDLIRSVQPPGKGKALPYKVGALLCFSSDFSVFLLCD